MFEIIGSTASMDRSIDFLHIYKIIFSHENLINLAETTKLKQMFKQLHIFEKTEFRSPNIVNFLDDLI